MSSWYSILYLIGAAILVWYGFRTVRNNPTMFSREYIGKSFYTMALLALGLIAFIAFMILLLKNG